MFSVSDLWLRFLDCNRNFDFNAIQLEFPFPEIRDTPQSRNTFSSIFVNIIKEYIQTHTSIDILLIE